MRFSTNFVLIYQYGPKVVKEISTLLDRSDKVYFILNDFTKTEFGRKVQLLFQLLRTETTFSVPKNVDNFCL